MHCLYGTAQMRIPKTVHTSQHMTTSRDGSGGDQDLSAPLGGPPNFTKREKKHHACVCEILYPPLTGAVLIGDPIRLDEQNCMRPVTCDVERSS